MSCPPLCSSVPAAAEALTSLAAHHSNGRHLQSEQVGEGATTLLKRLFHKFYLRSDTVVAQIQDEVAELLPSQLRTVANLRQHLYVFRSSFVMCNHNIWPDRIIQSSTKRLHHIRPIKADDADIASKRERERERERDRRRDRLSD